MVNGYGMGLFVKFILILLNIISCRGCSGGWDGRCSWIVGFEILFYFFLVIVMGKLFSFFKI